MFGYRVHDTTDQNQRSKKTELPQNRAREYTILYESRGLGLDNGKALFHLPGK